MEGALNLIELEERLSNQIFRQRYIAHVDRIVQAQSYGSNISIDGMQ
jgi:hypothetical protein